MISDFVIDELTRTWAHLATGLKASPDDLADCSVFSVARRTLSVRVDLVGRACDLDPYAVIAIIAVNGSQ